MNNETILGGLAAKARLLPASDENSWAVAWTTVAGFAIIALTVGIAMRGEKQPPWLWGAVPIVSNTMEFLLSMHSFGARARRALEKSDIIRFYLGPLQVYMIKGPRNVQEILKPGVVSSRTRILAVEALNKTSKPIMDRIKRDDTGALTKPLPGSTLPPGEMRFWHGSHMANENFLHRTKYADSLAAHFYHFLEQRLGQEPPARWETVRVLRFAKAGVFEAATRSLLGTRVLEMNPGLAEAFWEFDAVVPRLVWGLPNWLDPHPVEVQTRYQAMLLKYVRSAKEKFDWDGPDRESDWEPHFGSRLARERHKFEVEYGFDEASQAGSASTLIFGLNANTIPMIAWALFEISQDASLLAAVRQEVLASLAEDPGASGCRYDMRKLLAQPLLQSIYVECLRLHLIFVFIRDVSSPMKIAGYTLQPGSIIQAPSSFVHLDEAWEKDGHPADEFWAARHTRMVETVDENGKMVSKMEFTMEGRAGQFIPYGGGSQICPGRHFAKQEIMLAIAMVADRFDMEFVRWVNYDGSPSERPAQNHTKWWGTGGVPPDRDMEIRWKRRW